MLFKVTSIDVFVLTLGAMNSVQVKVSIQELGHLDIRSLSLLVMSFETLHFVSLKRYL